MAHIVENRVISPCFSQKSAKIWYTGVDRGHPAAGIFFDRRFFLG